MGAQLCKGGIPSHHQQKFNLNKIPEISDKIKKYLQEKKPFENKIKTAQQNVYQYQSGIYVGQVNLINKPEGYGKYYKKDGSLYIGSFSNGYAEGKGVYIMPNGSYFEGDFQANSFKKGLLKTKDFSYNGYFKENIYHGKGYEQNMKQSYEFEGIFNLGKKVNGVMKWKKEQMQYIFQGNFSSNGQFQSGGKIIQNPLGFYLGQFKNNFKHGKGTYQYNNGIKYVGQYSQGFKEGFGTLYNSNGTVSYEGQFKNGLPHGKGKAFNKQNKALETSWIEGIDQKFVQN